jgi:hypothetical protein
MDQSLREIDSALRWSEHLNELAKHAKWYAHVDDLKASGTSGIYHFLGALSCSSLDNAAKQEMMRNVEALIVKEIEKLPPDREVASSAVLDVTLLWSAALDFSLLPI